MKKKTRIKHLQYELGHALVQLHSAHDRVEAMTKALNQSIRDLAMAEADREALTKARDHAQRLAYKQRDELVRWKESAEDWSNRAIRRSRQLKVARDLNTKHYHMLRNAQDQLAKKDEQLTAYMANAYDQAEKINELLKQNRHLQRELEAAQASNTIIAEMRDDWKQRAKKNEAAIKDLSRELTAEQNSNTTIRESRDYWKTKAVTAEAHNTQLQGTYMADQERLIQAAAKANVTFMGSDTPDALAERIVELHLKLEEREHRMRIAQAHAAELESKVNGEMDYNLQGIAADMEADRLAEELDEMLNHEPLANLIIGAIANAQTHDEHSDAMIITTMANGDWLVQAGAILDDPQSFDLAIQAQHPDLRTAIAAVATATENE